jgi:hypothetical protein
MKSMSLVLLSVIIFSSPLIGDQNQDTERIEAKVTKYVTSYYKTHAVEGKARPNGYTIVDVDITKTEPKDGWGGTFVTTGRATISAVYGGSNYGVEFEATSVIDDKDVLRVTEVKTVKVDD